MTVQASQTTFDIPVNLPPIEEMPEELAQKLANDAIQEELAAHRAEMAHRAKVMLLCENDHEQMGVELYQCKRDFIYFAENWLWIEEVRSDIKRIPFLMYGYQKDAAIQILNLAAQTVDSIEKYDVLVEKTRDMGWSWLMCALAVWLFIFHDKNILFGSRKAELADKLGDMKSLLEKCRYLMRNLPPWFFSDEFNPKPGGHMGEFLIRKPPSWGTGTIAGESANPDFGRGDRKYIIILDEFASWAYDHSSAQACGDATSVRVFISTPKGPFNKFAAMRRGEEGESIKPIIITSHWLQHPKKAAGACIGRDGKPTSPYYRVEQRKKSADEMAAEIDICYEASTKGRVFEEYLPTHHKKAAIEFNENYPILRIWDPGIHFYVLFMQIDKYSRVLALREVYQENAYIRDVAEEVLYLSHKYYGKCDFVDYGDPAQHKRMQSSADRAEYEILADEYGITVDSEFIAHVPSHLRVPNRIQAIKAKLTQWLHQTKSHGLLIDADECPNLERALAEGYRYHVDKHTKKVSERPKHEHPFCEAIDCLGYGILAELGNATKSAGIAKPFEIERNTATWSTWGKRGGAFGRRIA